MAEIIGVRFKDVGKIYYFDPAGLIIGKGSHVIVETARGLECGLVMIGNSDVEDEQVVLPLKPVVRVATKEDLDSMAANRAKEKEAFAVCQEKIAKHKLEMKLVDVEYTFDGSKILFYFTADGRVDFRELVKDLAAVFRTRIELRQIGVRDEAKMLGGLGICGRPFCCSTFLDEFQPVSIKMAKEQGLSLNPVKISGTCGRLMCCLKHEQEAYEYLLKLTPRQGAQVITPDGKGTVVEVNLLTGKLKVKMADNPDAAPATYSRDDVKTLRDRGPKSEKKEPLLEAEPAEVEAEPVAEIPAAAEAAPVKPEEAEKAPEKKENAPEKKENSPEKREGRPHRRGGRRGGRGGRGGRGPRPAQKDGPKENQKNEG